MQKLTITRQLVMLVVLTLLAAGCAKKPAPVEPAPVEPTATEETAPVPEEPQVDEAADARRAAEEATRQALNGLVRIHFDFDQYVLTDSAKQTLMSNANLLTAAPTVRVQVEGHCDERGSDEYNLALGEKRALAVKNYLVSVGIAAGRVSIISYGEEVALDSAQSESAWAKNRRADFKASR